MEINVVYFNSFAIEKNLFYPQAISLLTNKLPLSYINDMGFIVRYETGETYNELIERSFGIKASQGFIYRICPECKSYTNLNEIWDIYIDSYSFQGVIWTSCDHPLMRGVDIDRL